MKQINTSYPLPPPKPPRRGGFRFIAVFIILVLLPIAGSWVYYFYREYRITQAVDYAKESLKQYEQDIVDKKMADTIGGKTPQETLQLYITAVEKGDYVLASKYFIEKNRQKELESWNNATKKDVDRILELLRQTIKNQGSYSEDKNGFAIRKPLLVDFEKYPNGVWKIIEI